MTIKASSNIELIQPTKAIIAAKPIICKKHINPMMFLNIVPSGVIVVFGALGNILTNNHLNDLKQIPLSFSYSLLDDLFYSIYRSS